MKRIVKTFALDEPLLVLFISGCFDTEGPRWHSG